MSARLTRRVRRGRRETGAAVADFALTAALLTLLVLVVRQVGWALFVRNTLIWCAGEGARGGARSGGTPAGGADRTRALIRESLSERFADAVDASYQQAGGVTVVEVRVQAPVPVVGMWGPGRGMSLSARSYADEAGS